MLQVAEDVNQVVKFVSTAQSQSRGASQGDPCDDDNDVAAMTASFITVNDLTLSATQVRNGGQDCQTYVLHMVTRQLCLFEMPGIQESLSHGSTGRTGKSCQVKECQFYLLVTFD